MSQGSSTTGRRGFLKRSAFAVAAAQLACTADAAGGAIAETQYGKVRGVSENGVHRFLGIRYGADTGGTNCFQPPVKPEPWTGVRDAVEWGNVAPQALPTGGIDYTLSVQWHNRPGGEGEDGRKGTEPAGAGWKGRGGTRRGSLTPGLKAWRNHEPRGTGLKTRTLTREG